MAWAAFAAVDGLVVDVDAPGWRAEHSAPLAIPHLEETTTAEPVRAHRSLVPLVEAAAVAMIIIAVWAVGPLLPRNAGTPAAPPSSPTVTASRTTSTPSSPPPSATRAPACTGAQLSASIGSAGLAAGTENILVLLRNISHKSCYLGGILPLTGVRADGTKVSLTTRKTPIPSDKFYGSTDAPIADLGHISGPGPVARVRTAGSRYRRA